MNSRTKILIVEDEMIIATDISDLLERSGYTVVGVAVEAERALVLADQHRPHVAIVDVKLATELNGMTVARELSERYGTRIVFATANAESVVKAAREVADCVLAKPYRAKELLEAVWKCQRLIRDAPPEEATVAA